MQGYVDLNLSCTIEFNGEDRGCFELRTSAMLGRLQLGELVLLILAGDTV